MIETTPPVPNPCVNCVLVPVDGTPRTDRAVPAAVSIGSRFDVPVRPVAMTTDRADGSRIIDDLCAEFPRLRDPAVAGGPEMVIGLLAEADDRSGLVVAAVESIAKTTRSGRRMGRPLLDLAARPVVIIGPEVGRTPSPEEFVVPIDGTEHADGIVPAAMAWALTYGLALKLVAIVKPEPSSPIHDRSQLTSRQRFALDPEAHLAQLLDGQHCDALELTTQVVRAPIGLAAEIGPMLRHTQQSLLVISSATEHRHRPLADRNSPAAILRQSPVPVLVVPPTSDRTTS
jgi:nucleotide-binding universal stress UspA family protein